MAIGLSNVEVFNELDKRSFTGGIDMSPTGMGS